MKAEDTLQFMFDFYTDFASRRQLLNFLFCTVGNGFHWVNGELVYSEDRMDRDQLKECVEYAQPSELNLDLYEIQKSKAMTLKQRLIKQGRNIDEIQKIVDEFLDQKMSMPDKSYSHFYNYPKDIKEDWLKLIKETEKYLIEDGYEL